MDESEFVIVYSGNSIDTGFVRSLLESEGIEVFLKDEAMGTLAPWYVTAAGVGAVKVVVQRKDIDAAQPIVDEFMEENG